ncbi:NUDIX hydrolase [Alkalicella caledoniensis]|uniref:NUDIX hydrolase n=1 Tax=Alkalicella caledoniensis TaxID=2731377 RepID=A0A7G9W6B5_ALKCA|nr:NUDIX hydrolase [Alkalicella caledoniensis]QNO14227.1 NUDIX hydrolase [Alkalicella caledoniensis]
MKYITQIKEFAPRNNQEIEDKEVILKYIEQFPNNVLLTDNQIAHITSSGFIMNKDLTKVLMIHHNILNKWAWTGGHADGDENLLEVAIKEAKEETGINNVMALTEKIMSLDILYVPGHIKNNKYVNTHLHLSIAYVLIACEDENISVNEAENSGVKWIEIEKFNEENFNKYDSYMYDKLIERSKTKVKR